jgi:PAS domain S-box-containing protein
MSRFQQATADAGAALPSEVEEMVAKLQRSLAEVAERERLLIAEGRDITHRQRAEEELQASRRMLKLVLDTIPVRVFWKDRDGCFLGCNWHFARDAGLSSTDEIIGKNDHQLSWRAQAEQYRADDRRVMESGVARVAYEEPQTRPDGTELWLRTSKIPLRDADEQIVGVLGVYEDITDRKRAEQERLRLEVQMQQAQKLESLGVLAGGIAHDFNNLLVAVLGNLEIVRLRLPAGSTIAENLNAIETAALRAGELSRQMLAYSGRGRFVVGAVDVNALVREMSQLLMVSVSKKTELTLELEENLPSLQADATQVRQVVMNLITNASESLTDGVGRVRLRTGSRLFADGELRDEFTHGSLPGGRYVVIVVEDTGQGMDRGTVGRIFEPFFTTKFTGRGLGLAAVLGIVRGHRGTIKVESTVGQGTLFCVFLPASQVPALPTVEATVADSEWLGRGRVLLVDDEAGVRSTGTELLREIGFEVVVAADGRAALDLYRPGRFACVILDLTMPRLDGAETMRELTRLDPGVKVVLSSGYDAEDVQSRLGELRPAGFLGKPFSLLALRQVLRATTG